MTPQLAKTLAVYNRRMNETLYERVSTLKDDQQKTDKKAFFGSIHGTLNHLVWGDSIWMSRFDKTQSPGGTFDTEMYSTLAELTTARCALDARIEVWARRLTDGDLAENLTGKLGNGEPFSRPMWMVVAHFFNHQTHHRGQVATLLNQAGVDLGVTDLPVVVPHAIE